MSFHSCMSGWSLSRSTACAAIFLALAALGAIALGQPADGDKRFQSPHATFRTAKVALQEGNVAELCDCLTADSRDLLAGGLTINVVLLRKALNASSNEDDKRMTLKLSEALTKHGLAEDRIAKIEMLAGTFKSEFLGRRLEIARSVLEPVRRRSEFTAELIAALQTDASNGNSLLTPVKGGSELTELKFNGDSAQGVVVHKQGAKETRSVILFHKDSPDWKIDMKVELNRAFDPRPAAKSANVKEK